MLTTCTDQGISWEAKPLSEFFVVAPCLSWNHSISTSTYTHTRWHKKTGTSEMPSGSHIQLAALRNRDL